jgi:hypothetical protein
MKTPVAMFVAFRLGYTRERAVKAVKIDSVKLIIAPRVELNPREAAASGRLP